MYACVCTDLLICVRLYVCGLRVCMGVLRSCVCVCASLFMYVFLSVCLCGVRLYLCVSACGNACVCVYVCGRVYDQRPCMCIGVRMLVCGILRLCVCVCEPGRLYVSLCL